LMHSGWPPQAYCLWLCPSRVLPATHPFVQQTQDSAMCLPCARSRAAGDWAGAPRTYRDGIFVLRVELWLPTKFMCWSPDLLCPRPAWIRSVNLTKSGGNEK
jgi:hypothetical protein